MLDVTKICFTFLFFSNFSISGITLKISPTLAPWNHINFPLFFFCEKKQNFSLNLVECSLFFNIRKKIIKGESKMIKFITIL